MATDTSQAIIPTPAATREAADVDVPASVEAALVAFLDAEAGEMIAMDPALDPLVSVARAAVLGGGKRIRPTFAYWGWRGVVGGSAPLEPVLPALAALELLHAFALVHDDVMDGSSTRRGRQTAHKELAAGHLRRRLRGSADRFGVSGAILVGDLCLVWADRLIAQAGLSGDRIRAARHGYDRMRLEAIAGQFLDILGESSPVWSVERALRTARLKTASYTVARPLLYGAELGDISGSGADRDSLRQAYSAYGIAVGEAFQLRDDFLDVYGDPVVTGKPAGSDFAAGKPTVLLQLALALASSEQRAELELLQGRARGADMGRLGVLLRETGATACLHEMITQRVSVGLGALQSTAIDARARLALAELAEAAAFRAA